jgi:hypothetical protein
VYAGDSTPQAYGGPVEKWPGLSASLVLTFPETAPELALQQKGNHRASLLATRANAMTITIKTLITAFTVFIVFLLLERVAFSN